MKKYLVFAIMAFIAVAAQAQIVSSRSSRVTTTKTISEHPKGWNDIYVQYNMLKNGVYDDLSKDAKDAIPSSINGITIGYNRAINIAPSIPLYLLVGGAFEYNFVSADYGDSEKDSYYSYSYSEDYKGRALSVKIPVSVTYHFDLGEKFALEPYAGLNARFYISASGDYDRTSTFTYDGRTEKESRSSDINFFDKDDTNGHTANRFVFGGQIGVTAVIAKRFTATFAFDSDFTKIHDDVDNKCYRFNFGIGYRF